MPSELPKQLLLRQEVDYKIELEPSAKLPAQASYRMSPLELEEFQSQIKALLDAGYI